MEEDAVLSAGLGVMDQLIRGEYDEVYEELRSDTADLQRLVHRPSGRVIRSYPKPVLM